MALLVPRDVRYACPSPSGRSLPDASGWLWLIVITHGVRAVRKVLTNAAAPVTRLVELPGRGVTRMWECAGPPGAGTLMLIHGVACTAELNWGKVLAPLAAHFRVLAPDLRGHGDGIQVRSRFQLEDCADDIAALAGALGIGRFTAVGYSMGGMVAQLVYRRHAPLVSGLVLCSTAGRAPGSPLGKLAAPALSAAAAAMWWNPVLQLMSAEALGMALLGPIGDPATTRWARAQLRRTTLASVVSASQAVSTYTAMSWLGQVGVPAAVVVTTRDRIVPASRQLELARAIPRASVHQVDAGHGVCLTAPQVYAPALLSACWSVQPGHGRDNRRPGAA